MGHSPVDDSLGGIARLVEFNQADNTFNWPDIVCVCVCDLPVTLRSRCALVPGAGEHTPGERTPRDTADTKVLKRSKLERTLIVETVAN